MTANHVATQRVRPMLKSSKPAARERGNDKEDAASREAPGATDGEKPSKGLKAQGRHRHETRLEKQVAEGSVEGVRNPEGAAKPGEVSPVAKEARRKPSGASSVAAPAENVEGPKNSRKACDSGATPSCGAHPGRLRT